MNPGQMIELETPAFEVAPLFLGAVVEFRGIRLRLTEVEAYSGQGDPASHSVKGHTTAKNALFGPVGTLYIYQSYGMHYCGNITCEADGSGSAVLLRAGEVVAGLDLARQHRGFTSHNARPDCDLAKGPGNLGRVMGWTTADSDLHVGIDFTLTLPTQSPSRIASGPRVGVSVAHERPWRFWLGGDPTVSRYSRSPRAVSGELSW